MTDDEIWTLWKESNDFIDFARALLSASIADTASPTYQDGYQDAWIEPCPNCGHVKGKELDNGEIK